MQANGFEEFGSHSFSVERYFEEVVAVQRNSNEFLVEPEH
jgi:hypothetical protein